MGLENRTGSLKNKPRLSWNYILHLLKLIRHCVNRYTDFTSERIIYAQYKGNRDVFSETQLFGYISMCHSWDGCTHGYPPQSGRLTLPSLSKSCLPQTEWGGTTIARRTQSIFSPSIGDSASLLSLSQSYHKSAQPDASKKRPRRSHFYKIYGSPVFCAALSYIVSSQGFTDAITFLPDLVKWVSSNSLWQNCRLNLWNP